MLKKMRQVRRVALYCFLSFALILPLVVCGHQLEGKFKISGDIPSYPTGLLQHAKRLKSCLDGNVAECTASQSTLTG